jgi:hypothetical protein
MANGDVTLMSTVFTMAFLSVMSLFAVGNCEFDSSHTGVSTL